MLRPALLQWVNQGSLISVMLASVMCGTGLTLEQKDFTAVVQADWTAIPLGVACQFLIMPLAAFGVGRSLLLSSTVTTTAAASPVGPALFLGLLLVGCSPGGTASNLVSLIAQANVALSVLLTSVSTILAAVVTPLLVQFFVGSTVSVSGWALCQATAKVVLGPVLLGMVVNSKAPQLAQRVSRVTPFASVLLVSLICGGVVAQNASLLLSNATLLPRLAAAVLVLHSIGFAMGYWIPKRFFGKSEQTARTIAIETGMQNSALAVVLARSIATVGPLACVPGALSATAHSCLGSLLAAYWRLVDGRRLKQQEEERKNMMRTYTGDDEFDRGMMI
jgi:BASS family bile acid:Na+ symporter